MTCKNCSTEFEGKFCPECGAAAEIAEETAAAEVVETVAETVAPAEEAVVETAEIAEEAVAETAESFVSGSTPEPEFIAEQPVTYGYEPPEEPKKKKKTGLIAIIVAIVVILAAAFCVTAFTDVVISKQTQMANAFIDFVDVDIDDSLFGKFEYMQGKMSATINENHKEFTTDEDKEMAKMIADFAETLDLEFRVGAQDKSTIYDFVINENDKALLNIQGMLDFDNEQLLFGGDFTDVVLKLSLEELNLEENKDVDADKIKAAADAFKEKFVSSLKETLKNSDITDGVYNGKFDLGAQVKTLTVTLKGEEYSRIFVDSCEVFYLALGKVMPTDINDIADEMQEDMVISVFYDGTFSFDKTGYGFSITVEGDELIFYSNRVDKRIIGEYTSYTYSGQTYGAATYIVNEFEKKADGNESGKITFMFADYDENGDVEDTEIYDIVTYNIGKTSGSVSIEERDVKLDFTYNVNDDKVSMDFKATLSGEELCTFSYEFGKGEPFTVDLDGSKVIDIINDGESSPYYTDLISDIQDWLLDKAETSDIIALVMSYAGLDEGGNTTGMTDAEAYMYNNFGIDFYSMEFEAANSATFVSVDEENGIIDLQEVGYDGDTVKEMYQTVYFDAYGYSESEKEAIADNFYNLFGAVDELDCAFVDIYEENDYIILEIYSWDMDNADNLKALNDAGVIMVKGSNVSRLSYSATASLYASSGYTKIG